MAHTLSYETNMSKIQNSNLFTFIATLIGVVIGVMASLAMMGPMVRSEVSSATSGLRSLNAKPTSSVTSCVAPGGAGNEASVKTAATTMPAGGKGGGESQTPGSFVKKIVGGFVANTTASMSNTGPYSHNEIKTINKNETTITNNNNVSVSNSNVQTANSGAATVSTNTNAGSAHSGTAANDNDTSTSINISN